MWSFMINEEENLSGELSWSEAQGIQGPEFLVWYFNEYVKNVYRPDEVIHVMNMIVPVEECLKDGSLLFHLVKEVFPSARFEGKMEPSYKSPTKEQLEEFENNFVQ